MNRFDGEDLEMEDRIRAQKKQTNDWLLRQQQQNKLRKMLEEEHER